MLFEAFYGDRKTQTPLHVKPSYCSENTTAIECMNIELHLFYINVIYSFFLNMLSNHESSTREIA